MRRIVLASASPRRVDLLNSLGVKFDVFAPDIDEEADNNEKPENYTMRLSDMKAGIVCDSLGEVAIVVAADTVVYKGCILGKPDSYEEAFAMLEQLSGRWHTVVTGYTVVDMYRGIRHVGCEKTSVKMRDMPQKLIKAYLQTGESFDKAGAYGLQGYGGLLVERIEGCYSNVVGLPVMKIAKVLEEMGVQLFAKC